jgi:hypothetical protein
MRSSSQLRTLSMANSWRDVGVLHVTLLRQISKVLQPRHPHSGR